MEFANGRQGKTCDVSVSYSTRQYIVVVFTKSKVDDHHKKKEKKNRIVEKGLDIATVQECWPLVPERDWIKQCVTAR